MGIKEKYIFTLIIVIGMGSTAHAYSVGEIYDGPPLADTTMEESMEENKVGETYKGPPTPEQVEAQKKKVLRKRKGHMSGVNGYRVFGTVYVESFSEGGGRISIRGLDMSARSFNFYVYLSNSALSVREGVRIGQVKHRSGNWKAVIPEHVTVDDYKYVVIFEYGLHTSAGRAMIKPYN